MRGHTSTTIIIILKYGVKTSVLINNLLVSMINSDLHIIVPDAVDQESLQVEQVIGVGQLQQAGELDTGVALRYLTDEPDQGYVAQGHRVLCERRVWRWI